MLLALMVFQTFEVALIISASILTSAMVADVVEESELATGRRSEGVFFAGLSLVGKAVAGIIGVMLSTVILSFIGFPQNAQPGAVDPEIITNLAIVFVPVLSLLYLISAFLVTAFRISRAKHEENLQKLAGGGRLTPYLHRMPGAPAFNAFPGEEDGPQPIGCGSRSMGRGQR